MPQCVEFRSTTSNVRRSIIQPYFHVVLGFVLANHQQIRYTVSVQIHKRIRGRLAHYMVRFGVVNILYLAGARSTTNMVPGTRNNSNNKTQYSSRNEIPEKTTDPHEVRTIQM